MEQDKVNTYSRNLKTRPATADSSRDTDLRALLACARRLDEARGLMAKDQKSKENLRIYGEALRYNQRLWTIFQVALCDPKNALPPALKTTLLNLSHYVDRTSFDAVGKYRPDLLDSLITINRSIAAGLSKPVAGDAPMPVDTPDVPTYLTTSA